MATVKKVVEVRQVEIKLSEQEAEDLRFVLGKQKGDFGNKTYGVYSELDDALGPRVDW